MRFRMIGSFVVATSLCLTGCGRKNDGHLMYKRAVHCWAAMTTVQALSSAIKASGAAADDPNLLTGIGQATDIWRERAISSGRTDGKSADAVRAELSEEMARINTKVQAGSPSSEQMRGPLKEAVEDAKGCNQQTW